MYDEFIYSTSKRLQASKSFLGVLKLFRTGLVVLDGAPTTSVPKGLTVWRLELLANYIVEASVPTIILFSVIHKDVDNSYN